MGAGRGGFRRRFLERPCTGSRMLASGLRTYRYLQRQRVGAHECGVLHLRGFAEVDAVRYLRQLLQNENHANSEQPTQLFSI